MDKKDFKNKLKDFLDGKENSEKIRAVIDLIDQKKDWWDLQVVLWQGEPNLMYYIGKIEDLDLFYQPTEGPLAVVEKGKLYRQIIFQRPFPVVVLLGELSLGFWKKIRKKADTFSPRVPKAVAPPGFFIFQFQNKKRTESRYLTRKGQGVKVEKIKLLCQANFLDEAQEKLKERIRLTKGEFRCIRVFFNEKWSFLDTGKDWISQETLLDSFPLDLIG